MQGDRAAGCRLLDVDLAAVYGDVLHIRLRVRIVRRRDGIAVEEIALAAEIVNRELVRGRGSRHVEDAAADRARRGEILHMACTREIPACAGGKVTDVQLGSAFRPALPKSIVAHAEVDLTRAVPLPRGICGIETDVDDAVCRAEISFEQGLVRARARHSPCTVCCHVDVDPTLIGSRSGGACEECAVRRLERAARDTDVGCGCIECCRCLCAVRFDVCKSVDLHGGACARRTRLYHSGICRRSGRGAELHRFARTRVNRDLAAVLCLDGGAARGKHRDIKIARVLDRDFLARSRDACDGGGVVCRNDEVMPLHIDGEGSRRIVIRDGSRNPARRDRRTIFRKDVAAIGLTHAIGRVYRVSGSIRNRRGKVLDRLIVVDGFRRTVYAAMIRTKRDVAGAARHLRARCSQSFEHLDRAAEVVTVRAVHVVELLCQLFHDINDICRSDARMLGNHCGVAVCLRLFDLDASALERGRRSSIMLEEEVRMPRIVRDGEILRFLHVDIAGTRSSCAAREFREAACDKSCRRAVVLVVPRTAVLQIEIHLAIFAGKNRARERGVCRRESKARERLLRLICGVLVIAEDIALDLDLARAENARLVHIDEDARALSRVADGAVACGALVLTDGHPVEPGRAAGSRLNAGDIVTRAAFDFDVRIADHAQEVVAVVVDAVGLALPLGGYVQRLCRNGHRSVAAARRSVSAVINACKEAEPGLFRRDGQRPAVGAYRQRLVVAEDGAVVPVGLERRVLRKGVDARRFFDLRRDVLGDIPGGNLTRKFGLLLLIRRLGRRGVLVVLSLSGRAVIGDFARPFCGRGNKPLVDLDGAGEIRFTVLVLRIGELVRECIQYGLYVAVRDAARIGAECDVRIRLGALDRDIAAVDCLRITCIMTEDKARVTAVFVDLDVFPALPHDAGFVCRIAAREFCEAGSGERSVPFEYAGLHLMRPCRAVAEGEVRCAGENGRFIFAMDCALPRGC